MSKRKLGRADFVDQENVTELLDGKLFELGLTIMGNAPTELGVNSGLCFLGFHCHLFGFMLWHPCAV